MSARKFMSKMLDELMGTCRNGENSRPESLHFSSVRVCKSFLLNCCPHEILANTRFNLGKCPKVHDVALKADFEISREHEYEYQVEAHEQLDTFIVECKRRTHIAKLRLAAAQDALKAHSVREKDSMLQYDVKIDEKISKVEELGTSGEVDDAIKLTKEVDDLKKEKADTAVTMRNAAPVSRGQQKKLRICEVCSSYLGLDEGDERMADHFSGRLHLGFLHIREKYKELEDAIQERCIKNILDHEFQLSKAKKRQSSTFDSNEVLDSCSSKKPLYDY